MEENITLVGMSAVPVITGFLQAVKGVIPDKLVPFAAMATGVVWNVGLTAGTDEFDRTAIFLGLVIGLAASGLYSGGKTAITEARERLSR